LAPLFIDTLLLRASPFRFSFRDTKPAGLRFLLCTFDSVEARNPFEKPAFVFFHADSDAERYKE
jgi:hypothetical protein